MNLYLRTAPILFSATQSWAQTYCQDGIGIVLCAVDGKDGHALLDKLTQLLADEKFTDVAAFQSRIGKVLRETASADVDLSLGIFQIKDRHVWFFGKDTYILLRRDGKTAQLIKKNGAIGGELKDGDLVLLINAAGYKLFGGDRINARLGSVTDVNKFCEEILVELHQQTGEVDVVGLAAAVFAHKEKRARKKLRIDWRIKIPKKLWILLMTVLLTIILFNHFSGPGISPEKFSEQYELAQHKFEEGKALLELNRIRARDVLAESNEELESLLGTLPEGQEEYKKAAKLLEEVKSALEEASAAYKTKPKIFFDLGLIRDGWTANMMEGIDSKVFLYSAVKKSVATVNLENKANRVIAGGEWLSGATDLTVSADRQYVVLAEGIGKIGESENVVIEKDEEWGEIKDAVFFGGNLYLLDGAGVIWKYIAAGESFSNKREYLKGDFRLDNPVSMAIDGNIWVVDGGAILKFVGGRRDSFFVRGLEEALGNNAIIYKTKTLNNIYLLDKDNNRIVVIDEEGEFHAEYIWEKMGSVSAFVVSEEKGNIYLLVRDKIYTIELQ